MPWFQSGSSGTLRSALTIMAAVTERPRNEILVFVCSKRYGPAVVRPIHGFNCACQELWMIPFPCHNPGSHEADDQGAVPCACEPFDRGDAW